MNISYQGAATMLSFFVPVGQATGGLSFLPNPQVAVTDVGNNVVTSMDDGSVTVSLSTNTAGGTLSGQQLSEKLTQGVAVFHELKLDVAGSDYILKFESSTLSIDRNYVYSGVVTVGVGPVAHLQVTTTVRAI